MKLLSQESADKASSKATGVKSKTSQCYFCLPNIEWASFIEIEIIPIFAYVETIN